MKVYVVFEGYEDVIGVFSSRELAEAYIEQHMRDNPSIFTKREKYSNLEYTLDSPDRE